MIEAPLSSAPHLKQPIEEYLESRQLSIADLEQSLAELQVLAGETSGFAEDYPLNFSLSMIHLRLLEGDVPPALLLFEIVDIAQFALAYFHDERALNDLVSTIRQSLH